MSFQKLFFPAYSLVSENILTVFHSCFVLSKKQIAREWERDYARVKTLTATFLIRTKLVFSNCSTFVVQFIFLHDLN